MFFVESLIYQIKKRAPWLYSFFLFFNYFYVLFFYSNRIKSALDRAVISETKGVRHFCIRPLEISDLNAFLVMLEKVPLEDFLFFNPHPLDKQGLVKVLNHKDILKYGVFADNEMIGYGLLKLFPCRKAYRGRLVISDWKRKGLGVFMSNYLNWQAGLMGFTPYATIHRSNAASLASHGKTSSIEIVRHLSEGYFLVRHILNESNECPQFNLKV